MIRSFYMRHNKFLHHAIPLVVLVRDYPFGTILSFWYEIILLVRDYPFDQDKRGRCNKLEQFHNVMYCVLGECRNRGILQFTARLYTSV